VCSFTKIHIKIANHLLDHLDYGASKKVMNLMNSPILLYNFREWEGKGAKKGGKEEGLS